MSQLTPDTIVDNRLASKQRRAMPATSLSMSALVSLDFVHYHMADSPEMLTLRIAASMT